MKKIVFFLCTLSIIGFHSCKEKSIAISKIEGKEIKITDSITSNKDLDEFIKPYSDRIEEEMSTTLAYAPKALSKSDAKFNTPIGNMEADAVMELLSPILFNRTQHNLDGVLLNYGGIRSSINKGNITTKTGYNIMPFENEAVVVRLNGEAMQELFNYLAEHQTAHPIAGMQLILNTNGSIKKALVKGNPIKKDRIYYIATNDYLQKGGDHMDFLSKTDTVINMNYKLRNLFIDYFKKKDTIAPVKDDRFIKLEE
ncbi:5'-nucleotidase C-terminal domain-containing protein [Mesonia aestuariivivens]|uniref:5'-nucleotidase C-terminal domain-containing protein n=1 Tax=Mesonia aestuariivivens TaxID=2796128 RepID=A0ABS6W012_9FLAO|nr:5'-nucleotidase [Mesonia aestuariivivens]MBW2961195.1 5'-nucleotidase C-terminal domain-containing protein [Mesonia aestuariivivens]